jgi:hypothetical protein
LSTKGDKVNVHHHVTDVWTSAGVLVGAGALAGWQRLNAVVTLIVAGNIVWFGIRIARDSASGLMDSALPIDEQDLVWDVLEQLRHDGIEHHNLAHMPGGFPPVRIGPCPRPGYVADSARLRSAEVHQVRIRCSMPNVEVLTPS